MKVTFTGHFKDVTRQVAAPVSLDDAAPQKFAKLIGDLEKPDLPKVDQIKTAELIAPSDIKFDPSDMMGRFDIKSYKLENSVEQVERLGEGDPYPGVKISAGDLKAPQILSAKRVSAAAIQNLQPKAEIASLINKTGLQEGVDPQLALAVARAESAFNPRAISTDGHASKGLFQLLDSTGQHLHSKLDMDGHYDPFNAKLNTTLGVNYLKYLHDIFATPTTLPNNMTTNPGSNGIDVEKFAVAAFNAGEGRVASAQERAKKIGKNPADYKAVEPFLPDSTQEYVTRVLSYKAGYEAEG
jgi:soluble lytic murein transglycosylase-like protein